MLRAMLRDTRAHLGRVAMTLAAVVLGVAFVVATWVVSDSAAATVAGEGDARTDLAARVTPAAQDGELTGADRDRFAALPEVRKAVGVVIGHSVVVRHDGKLGDTHFPDEGATNWDDSSRFSLVRGRGPVSAAEVALEAEAAADAGLSVGDTARVLDREGDPTSFTVVGVFTYRKTGPREFSPAIAYEPGVAQQRLGAGYRWIELYGDDAQAVAASARA